MAMLRCKAWRGETATKGGAVTYDLPMTNLPAALANDDHARVVALLERHATLDCPENKGFGK